MYVQAREHPYGKDPGDSGQWQVECEPAICLGNQNGNCQMGEERDCPTLLYAGVASP